MRIISRQNGRERQDDFWRWFVLKTTSYYHFRNQNGKHCPNVKQSHTFASHCLHRRLIKSSRKNLLPPCSVFYIRVQSKFETAQNWNFEKWKNRIAALWRNFWFFGNFCFFSFKFWLRLDSEDFLLNSTNLRCKIWDCLTISHHSVYFSIFDFWFFGNFFSFCQILIETGFRGFLAGFYESTMRNMGLSHN